MRIFVLLALACSVLLAADVTGSWKFQVETDGNTGIPTFELKQDGEKLSGSYSGFFGKLPVTGSVKGDAIVINIDIEFEGQKGKVNYSGKIESANKMSGKVDLAGVGSGT